MLSPRLLIHLTNECCVPLPRLPLYGALSHSSAFLDPLLYDILIRRFQSAAEREAEGRARGYGRVLEGSLLRGEAKLERIAASYAGVSGPESSSGARGTAPRTSSLPGGDAHSTQQEGSGQAGDASTNGQTATPEAAQTLDDLLAPDGRPPPATKEEAQERWLEFLRDRFVRGDDEEFDYRSVDQDADLDALERADEEDAYFDGEDPSWASDAGEQADPGDKNVREGETGIQDF